MELLPTVAIALLLLLRPKSPTLTYVEIAQWSIRERTHWIPLPLRWPPSPRWTTWPVGQGSKVRLHDVVEALMVEKDKRGSDGPCGRETYC